MPGAGFVVECPHHGSGGPPIVKRSRPDNLLIALISLGCPKNLVDSERLLATLALDGFIPTDSLEDADVALVNTCGFIESARTESVETLLEVARLKKEQGGRPLVVATGCMAQRYGAELARRMPEIDAFVGQGEYERISQICQILVRGRLDGPPVWTPAAPTTSNRRPLDSGPRLRLTPRHYAYVKISEGCDNPCTFCSIPAIRGAHRSKPIDAVLAELAELEADGVKEVFLTAQDTTDYGRDLWGQRRLPELLREITAATTIPWIKILYTYPAHLTRETVEAIAAGRCYTGYIDMPIQHAHDLILKRMRRNVGRRDLADRVRMIREVIPDATIRSTVIVGFPTETEEHFATLLEFLAETRFDRLGCFTYSDEEGTPSHRIPEQVTAKVMARRERAVMRLQESIAAERNAGRVGTVEEVIVDGHDGGRWVGRTRRDVPDIDGLVFFEGPGDLAPGDFVTVEVTGATAHDLTGRLVGVPVA